MLWWYLLSNITGCFCSSLKSMPSSLCFYARGQGSKTFPGNSQVSICHLHGTQKNSCHKKGKIEPSAHFICRIRGAFMCTSTCERKVAKKKYSKRYVQYYTELSPLWMHPACDIRTHSKGAVVCFLLLLQNIEYERWLLKGGCHQLSLCVY